MLPNVRVCFNLNFPTTGCLLQFWVALSCFFSKVLTYLFVFIFVLPSLQMGVLMLVTSFLILHNACGPYIVCVLLWPFIGVGITVIVPSHFAQYNFISRQ